jgi:rhomboid protease GluP
MDEPPTGHAIAFKTTQRDECSELRLVLIAMGIKVETVHHDHWWYLIVKQNDLATATTELETYRRENPDLSTDDSVPAIGSEDPYRGGAAFSVFGYALTIILIYLATDYRIFGFDWFEAGQMQSGKVMGGEYWRVVTALTLHLDVGHILSNLLFGAVFGYLAARTLGSGVAWLAIVIAGALGNFMNAMVQPLTHSSIGASTAVFAALGLIVSNALRSWLHVQHQDKNPLKRWSPLVGGSLLLAFLGIGGEHTDVIAHLTGFLAGLVIGWIGCRLPERWLSNRAVQVLAGIEAIGLIASAWIAAWMVR